MRKILCFLIAALCALLPAFSSLAQESTTVSATIPDQHTVTVVCGAHGWALVGGKYYSGTTAFTVTRLDSLTVTAVSESGYVLTGATASPGAGTSVAGGTVKVSGIYEDKTLTFTFRKQSGTTTATSTTSASETSETVLTPTPVGNVLYDDYLGTGSYPGDLAIVYDAAGQPADHDLLAVTPTVGTAGELLLIQAKTEQDSEPKQYSLILSMAQLTRLNLEQAQPTLLFENGSLSALIDMEELLTGNVAKLAMLLLSGNTLPEGEMTEEQLGLFPNIPLTAQQLLSVKTEVRITPVALADEERGYRVSVWMEGNGQTVEVSSWIPSLTICLNVPAAIQEADLEEYVQAHTVIYTDATGAEQTLPGKLLHLPEDLPQKATEQADTTCDSFKVSFAEETPMTLHETDTQNETYHRTVLSVPYMGAGIYRVMN